MRLTLFLILLLTACSQSPSPIVAADSLIPEDSAGAYCTREIKDDWVQDWPATVEIDSLTAKKARKFLAGFWEENMYISLVHNDTLLDLNDDGFIDILIEYYGTTGTGFKNAIEAYLYEKETGRFIYQEQLSALVNPTFYFRENIVCGYYVGYGGGWANMYKWAANGKKLDTLEMFTLDINNVDGFKVNLEKTNFQNSRKTHRWEADIIDLPRKYRYGKYSPLIRRNLSSPE